ncbi:MAG TPA: acetoacetate--CoA ligase, partial [Trueperaceae bacterium]|nr:acetoacetate--CoA ligase [Trueperaceae bacterium]
MPEQPVPEPLWRPSEARIEASAMEAFRRAAEAHAGRALPDYDALHAWSVARPEEFWELLARYVGLPLDGQVAEVRSSDPPPRTRWFAGASLNYARALLYPPELADPDQLAIIAEVEDGAGTTLSYRELRDLVAAIQGSLMDLGVAEGDAVAAFAANVPETVALLLACAGLGAVFSSCSPDFGAEAAVARFSQLEPKALFVTTGYRYGGRWFDTAATVTRVARELAGAGASETSLAAVVALPYPGAEPSVPAGVERWGDFLARAADAADRAPLLVDLPFDHPLYVLYSSGTTGTPKAMLHRAGGVLLTHAKEHLLHCDIRAGDRAFYFTTCGWMMWNWLVSALARAATLVLYDGSPAHPELERPFEVAERHEVTFFGTSARYLHTLKAAGSRPAERFDLNSIKTVASTGSPLSPAGFEYVYREVKPDVHLASISGGTDIVGCFMLGVPTLPVYAGEIQRPGLGVDLVVLDESGTEVSGEPGELVCRQPLPSM